MLSVDITMRYCRSHRGAAGLRSLVTAKSTPLVPSAAPPPPNAAPVGGKESSKDNGKDSGNRSQGGAHGSPGNSGGQIEAAGTAGVGNNLVLLELLDGTLNNRQLSGSSEELVAALAARVFEGIRDFVIQVCAHRWGLRYVGFRLQLGSDGAPPFLSSGPWRKCKCFRPTLRVDPFPLNPLLALSA